MYVSEMGGRELSEDLVSDGPRGRFPQKTVIDHSLFVGDHGNLFATVTPGKTGLSGHISLDDASYLGEDQRISDS